jgi:hypothetical protein
MRAFEIDRGLQEFPAYGAGEAVIKSGIIIYCDVKVLYLSFRKES